MTVSSKIVFCFIFPVIFLLGEYSSAQSNTNDTAISLLLSRLNLNQKGLMAVNELAGQPQNAAEELLKYYQSRTSVKHPVQFSNNKASGRDLTMANDALEHIFVGQPAYPSQFCGKDIDWSFRPVPDNEWVWQLNRMSFWNAMAKAYAQNNDEKYAKEWCAQIIDWTQKNPNDENHKYAWRSIEAGIRGNSWTGLFYQFISSPHYTPEVLVAFLNSMFDHADFLMTKYSTRSNWGLMEAEGMAFIAINFPEFADSKIWKIEALRRLNNEIELQVYADGHQRELAIGYHLGCINWFLNTYELAKLNDLDGAFPESYLSQIEKMCEVPMKIGLPDGTNAQFGDAWAGKPGQHKQRFREWSKMFHRDDFLFLATNGQQGKKPDSTAFALPESGIYSMRSSWDSSAVCLVLKCGPDGGGHCQPDNGTFELYAGGRNLMPDAGSYIYSGDPENRAWFRQTKVHQTLTLNGENSRYAPKLLKWQPGNDIDILVVENESYESLSHRRAVFFVDKRYFIIVDEAIGEGTGDVDIHFQFAPGTAVFNRDNFSVCSDFPDGYNVLVQTQKQNGLELTEEEGQVSFEYTKKEPRPAFRYRLKKEKADGQIRFVTLIAPIEGEKPKLEIRLIGQPSVGSQSIELELKENGIKRRIGYTL